VGQGHEADDDQNGDDEEGNGPQPALERVVVARRGPNIVVEEKQNFFIRYFGAGSAATWSRCRIVTSSCGPHRDWAE
jgi:hypothetical protein